MEKTRAGNGREVLIEIAILGTYAKVTAIDSASGTEVSVTAPANAPRTTLHAAAINKLEFVMNKKTARPI
jgi:hypothetical protein